MKKWEFSGNLDEPNGIKNYHQFQTTCNNVMDEYLRVFTEDVIYRYPLLVDNATKGSGHTPIITPILGEYLIIKLGVEDGVNIGQTIYQFAHELTHLVFFSLIGIDKKKAGVEEESLCTAASLCIIKTLHPNELELYLKHVASLNNEGYRNGLQVAIEHGFDFAKLSKSILSFAEGQNEELR